MASVPVPTADELRRKGFEALAVALGPVGAVRFLQQFDAGRGDYARDRERWLTEPSVEDLAQRVIDARRS
jgi:hypothetical protein